MYRQRTFVVTKPGIAYIFLYNKNLVVNHLLSWHSFFIALILFCISTDFIKMVLFSAIIASPIAWWLVHSWLQGFAYRVSIHWWVFAIAALLAVVVAFATISFQSVKAAMVNPIKSLRSE